MLLIYILDIINFILIIIFIYIINDIIYSIIILMIILHKIFKVIN